MPRRVRIPDRIIVGICEPVPGLHPLRLERYHRIRLDESAQSTVVPASPIIEQPQCGQFPLPGEVEFGRRSPFRVALLAPRPSAAA